VPGSSGIVGATGATGGAGFGIRPAHHRSGRSVETGGASGAVPGAARDVSEGGDA
jgi:hypothetical protein